MKNIKDYNEYNKIDVYINSVFEAIDNPLEVEYSFIDDVLYGTFNDGKTDYVIEAEHIIHNFFTFKFKANDNGEYTVDLNNNRGVEKYRVLATVKNSLFFILDELKPNGVIFGALDKSKGRKRLYDKFVEEYLLKNPNKDSTIKEQNNEKVYLIHNKDEDIETIIDVIKYAFENNISNR